MPRATESPVAPMAGSSADPAAGRRASRKGAKAGFLDVSSLTAAEVPGNQVLGLFFGSVIPGRLGEGAISMNDFGPRPELTWLPVKMMSVDPTYQRTMESRVSQRQIVQIVETFRWACFGTVLAVPHEDGWRIIDGQHRVEAAKRLGIPTVPAIVVPEASVAEQAQIFLSTNLLRSKVNPYALFHARIAAGEQLAVDTKDLLDEAGLWVAPGNVMWKDLKPGQTLALKTIENAVTAADAPSRAAVIAVGRAFEGKRGGATAVTLQAAILVARAYPDRVDAIRDWLARKTPEALKTQYLPKDGAVMLSQAISRAITSTAPAAAGAGSIPFPSRDRLMGGR